MYNRPNLSGTMIRYRVYLYSDYFLYSQDTVNYYNNSNTAVDIPVSDSFVYRQDFSSICVCSTIFIFAICILGNVVTSVFKKGGLFSGLI